MQVLWSIKGSYCICGCSKSCKNMSGIYSCNALWYSYLNRSPKQIGGSYETLDSLWPYPYRGPSGRREKFLPDRRRTWQMPYYYFKRSPQTSFCCTPLFHRNGKKTLWMWTFWLLYGERSLWTPTLRGLLLEMPQQTLYASLPKLCSQNMRFPQKAPLCL